MTHSSSDGRRGPPELTVAPYLTLLDRFDLLRPLGMGISGAVFEAVDRGNSQTVALKLLHRCGPSDLYRIKAEFRALAELAHPNLVAMHELFVDDQQRAFFTMELIQGEPFLQYLRPPGSTLDAPAAQERLRTCLSQLAHGVLFLHAHGKLHRDLKPSNVLVNPLTGRLTIVDFGLVQSTLEDPAGHQGEPRSFEGTPAYAAPEQLETRDAEPASDWYSIGVMLYEVLAGHRPYPSTESGLRDKSRVDAPQLSTAAEPSLCPALDEICLRLLERDPKRRAGGRELLAALGSAEQLHLPEPASDFIGRETELAHLELAFERAASGAGGALVIRGQSGMGKTSLAHAFLDQLRASGRAQVIRSRCYVQEALRYNAFDGIVDALTDQLRVLPGSELEPWLTPQIVALAQVFPVLRRLSAIDRLCRAEGASKSGARSDALAALRQLLSCLRERGPLALFIDDLQWADADSAWLLQELLSPSIPGLWLLATERSDEAPDGRTLERHLAERLALGPLSEASVAELARRSIDGCRSERAAEIATRSGGHPMFAGELIRYARSDAGSLASLALEAALGARLSALTSEAQAVLELVCLAGQRMPQSLLSDGHGAPPLAALRELRVAATIRDSLVDDEQHVEAYHDRIRELVVARLPATRRQALHSALAERMRARGAAYLERVIQRYVLAGRERDAALLAEEAAQQAAHGLAFHSASELLELALRHARDPSDQQRLRLLAADACAQAGRALAAAAHCEDAAAATDDPSERTELLLRAGTGYWAAGHGGRGREIVFQLSRELGGIPIDVEIGPLSVARGLLALLVMLLTGTPILRSPKAGHGADAQLAQPGDGAQQPSLRALWRIAPSLAHIDPLRSAAFVGHAFELSARQGQHIVYGQSLASCLCMAALLSGRTSWLIERHFDRAHRLVNDGGDFWEKQFVCVMQAGAAWFGGEDARTVELASEAAHMTRLGSPFANIVRNYARTAVMVSLHWLGDMKRLLELSELWTKDAIDTGDRQMQVMARIAGLHAHLGRDDVARALEEVELARHVDLDYLHVMQDFEPWWIASVHLYRGEPEEALAVCDDLRTHRPLYASYNAQSRIVWLLTEGTCAAALAAQGRDRDRALALLQRCARQARWSPSRRASPIAAQLSASLALLSGDRRKAIAAIQRAIAGYTSLDNRLHAASLQLALARLDPQRQRHLEHTALSVFAREGVVNPERFAAMIAPGLIGERARSAGTAR